MTESNPQNSPPQLQVDDNWKAQAQQEKERLAGTKNAETAPKAAAPSESAAPEAPAASATKAPNPPLPPASFELIVEQYATQVLFALGLVAHPSTGKRHRDLEVAKHYIDLLGVLETKTKGNLTSQEEELLSSALYQMRMNYVAAIKGR